MRVTVRHRFVGLLRRAVKRERVTRVAVFGEGNVGARTIHAARGSEHRVLWRMRARGFEHVKQTDEIPLHVSYGMPRTVTHIGLRAEVHDIVGFEMLPNPREFAWLGKIVLHETKVVAAVELGQARAL